MRLGVSPPPAMDGRRDRSAGSRRSRAARENRRWPPGVVKTRRRPASLQRRTVAGETPRTRLASERLTHARSGVSRLLKIYLYLSEDKRLAHYSSGSASPKSQCRTLFILGRGCRE